MGQHRLWRWQYKTAPYLFIMPFFILFAIFSLYPFLFSFYISLTKWNGSSNKAFIGLENYKDLLSNREFWDSILNSIQMFVLYVPVMILLALLFAVLLNQSWMKLKGFFRTVFFVPNIISVVAVTFVFSMMFNTHDGLINKLLMNAGWTHEAIPWLDSPWWAKLTVAFMVLYRWLGYNMLLLMAGLQNIPADLYESAKMDGATPAQAFWSITVPLIRKIIAFCTILSTIGTFSLFTEPFILTKGGPLKSTTTPVLLLYQESFQNFHFGYASSIAVCFFFLMMTLTIVQLKLFRDDNS